ncbi:MAG: hypothetical protein R3222_05995 [Balneolaceae bacterium]|nr:hypothetical protein [Balneolaceae bacterium]
MTFVNPMARNFTLFLLFLFLTVMAIPSFAQQQDTENSLLPEIDPQDIEIRSQFRASFPGIRRQPILGFDPTPRVYQVDPNRQPFMETQEQVVANLPVSELSRPNPPAYNPMTYSEDIQAYSRLGYGSFSSPEATFWGVHRINQTSYVGGNLDFSSSDGHLDTQPSSFRFFNANAEYAAKIDEDTRLQFNAGGQSDFHYLYELNNLLPVEQELGKNYTGFHLGGQLSRFQNTVSGWNIEAGLRYFDVDLENDTFTGDVDETVYRGSFAKRWAGNNVSETFTIKGGVRSGVYGIGGEQEAWTTLQGGVQYQRLFNYITKVTGEASVYYAADFVEEKVYFAPSLQVEHTFAEGLKITGKAHAKPYLKSVRQHHEFNRFIASDNILRHAYEIKASGEASIEYFRGSTLNGGVSYSNTKNLPYYSQSTPTPGESFYQINYDNATNFRIYAGLTHQLLPERFWVNGRIYAQSPKLDGGDKVPFQESWGINSSVHISPIKRITVEGWLDYIGKRETGITGQELDGIFLLGAQVDLEITDRFGAYFRGVNLLDDNYQVWEGYNERPLQLYGGVTVKL